MNRLDFYEIKEVFGRREYDYLQNSLSHLEINYPIQYYIVTESDIYRPDLISWKVYNTVNFWWVIMYVNNIFDVFKDLKVGMRLKIINILDLYDFYKKYKKRV